jgi:hypothetical protein
LKFVRDDGSKLFPMLHQVFMRWRFWSRLKIENEMISLSVKLCPYIHVLESANVIGR